MTPSVQRLTVRKDEKGELYAEGYGLQFKEHVPCLKVGDTLDAFCDDGSMLSFKVTKLTLPTKEKK